MGNPVSKNAISECGIHLKNAINHPYPKQKNHVFCLPNVKNLDTTDADQWSPNETTWIQWGFWGLNLEKRFMDIPSSKLT